MSARLGIMFLAAAIWVLNGTGAAAGAGPRPNFVFILTDDQRWNTMGCAGDRIIKTPNLDRLARLGVRFQNHFVTTSICCVSRASIFTGQWERRHHISDFATPFTGTQWAQTYPAMLRQAGYCTGFIGKFGVGADVQRMSAEFDYWRGLDGQGGLFFDEKDPERTHATARMGGQAIEFLNAQSSARPFCLSVSFTAPHARDRTSREFAPDPRDELLYTNLSLANPDVGGQFQQLPDIVKASEARTRWRWRFDTPEKFQANAKDYYRLISGIDREVGRIVEALAARKLTENTVIVFTSDNGFFLGDRGLSDKWFMYEESLRTPLIIFDPRQKGEAHGRLESAMTLNIDFAPTLLELAGVNPPAGMQGRSLAPLLANHRPIKWRSDFFYEHHYAPQIIPPSEGVRTERWAYIRWINTQPTVEELYDLKADPAESRNLIAARGLGSTLAGLRERWERLGEELK